MEEQIIERKEVWLYENDPYRFLIFPFFVLYNFILGMQSNPYSSIGKALSLTYQITPAKILTTYIAFLIGKISFSAFAGYLIEKIGLKDGILVGLLLALIGFYLRSKLIVWFECAVLGQTLLGVAISTIVASQLKFLYEWFHPRKRGFYCTIIAIAGIVGGGFGLLFMLFFVKDEELDVNVIESGLSKFNALNFIACSVLIIIHLLVFLEKPRDGYGYIRKNTDNLLPTDEVLDERERQRRFDFSMLDQAKALFRQNKFRRNLILYSFFVCLNIMINATINPIFDNFEVFGSKKIILVMTSFVSGLGGSLFFFKVLMPKPNNRDMYFKVSFCGLIFATVLMASLSMKLLFILELIFQSGFGFCFFLTIPVAMEYMIREVIDIPLPFVNGLMILISQSSGCIILGINGFFLWYFGKNAKLEVYIGTSIIFFLYTSVLIVMKCYRA